MLNIHRTSLGKLMLAGLVFLLITVGARASEDMSGATSTSPSMSPDGQNIVFSSDISGNANLWIITPNGQLLRKLTSGAGTDAEPSWSPDGQFIAFARTDGTRVRNIWSIRPDGSQLRQLTTKALNNFHPVWSPDSSRIAFVSDRGGSNDIWIMNADGSGQARVTSLPGEENDPSFSPSGTEIAFSEALTGKSSLFIVTLSTGAVRTLTPTGFVDWHPSWSVQGILFSSNRPPMTASGNKTIWIVQSDGTGLRQFSTISAIDPSWTPSGTVLFTDEDNPGVAATAGISLFNPISGGSPQPLLPAAFNGDLNGDGIIDLKDIAIIQQAVGSAAVSAYDPRDRNGDRKIDALDIRLLTTLCTYERCASTPN